MKSKRRMKGKVRRRSVWKQIYKSRVCGVQEIYEWFKRCLGGARTEDREGRKERREGGKERGK